MRKLPIPLVEKMNLLRIGGLFVGGRHEKPNGMDSRSALEWLRAKGQGPSIRNILWGPLCTAALNGKMGDVSAFIFRRVLEEIFFTGRGRARIGTPRGSLRNAFVEPALNFLTTHCAEVRTNARVRSILIDDRGNAEGVAFSDGSTEGAHAVICTAAPASMARILKSSKESLFPIIEGLESMENSGILTVYLWSDCPLFDGNFRALIGTFSQWVVHEGEELLEGGKSHRYAVVVSAVDSESMKNPATKIIEQVKEDLSRAFPGKRMEWLASRVVKYPRAVPLFRPGNYRHRSPIDPGVPGLALAGDHVRVALPATIESAIRSGHKAARFLLEEIQR